MEEIDQIEHMKNFIKNHMIMGLATVDGDQPHVCTVFYATLDAKSLYFISYNVTLHVKNLVLNPKISAIIYDKESSPFGEKQGIQILGTAKKMTTLEEATQAAEAYMQILKTPKDKLYPLEDFIKSDAQRSFFRVDVEKVKMLDTVNHIEPDAYLDI